MVLAEGLDKSTLPIAEFTKTLEDGGVSEAVIPWGYASWAIVAYRTRDYETALTAAEKALRDLKKAHPLPVSQSLLVAALASQKLNRPEDARMYARGRL